MLIASTVTSCPKCKGSGYKGFESFNLISGGRLLRPIFCDCKRQAMDERIKWLEDLLTRVRALEDNIGNNDSYDVVTCQAIDLISVVEDRLIMERGS